jgi:hypothetical protein
MSDTVVIDRLKATVETLRSHNASLKDELALQIYQEVNIDYSVCKKLKKFEAEIFFDKLKFYAESIGYRIEIKDYDPVLAQVKRRIFMKKCLLCDEAMARLDGGYPLCEKHLKEYLSDGVAFKKKYLL